MIKVDPFFDSRLRKNLNAPSSKILNVGKQSLLDASSVHSMAVA